MEPLKINWEVIKSKLKDKYRSEPLYIDEDDDVISFIDSDGLVSTYGYLHVYGKVNSWLLEDEIIDFIADLKKISDKYSDYQVHIILNLRPENDQKEENILPQDVRYYVFEEGEILEIDFASEFKQNNIKRSMMPLMQFQTACRNCLIMNPPQIVSIDKEQEEHFISMTEYELMTYIEHLRIENGELCEHCQSNNVEICDISINSQPLFNITNSDLYRIPKGKYICVLEFEKTNNTINQNIRGNYNENLKFLKRSLSETIKVVDRNTDNYFIEKSNGTFFICLTGSHNSESSDLSVKIQRMRTVGLNSSEVLTSISKIAKENDIDMNLNISNNSGKTILDGNSFSGSRFNNWFYADSLEDAESKGCYFANVCFDYDEKTIIAVGLQGNVSPKDFIEFNRNRKREFKVDLNKEPVNLFGKQVYYAIPVE